MGTNMEGKVDRADVEGQFGKPEFFARDGVKTRMDEKFPHHPLMRSEASYRDNWEQAEEDHGHVHATQAVHGEKGCKQSWAPALPLGVKQGKLGGIDWTGHGDGF